MKAHERFLKYVKVHTMGCEELETVPSTSRQFDLAKILVEELKKIGVENAFYDDKCYVYASIPATEECENAPSVGFIAHVDTALDFSGENVIPKIIENYDGNDVELGNGRTLKVSEFTNLKSLKGRTLITASGDTLLGADDKAGVAEIITLAERLISENIPHGKVCIGFTPDEEIGRGADHFDVKGFGADFAYTVDGGPEGEVVYENFNAYSARFDITGVSIHPGHAKNRMVNAGLVACEINSMLPSGETPRDTEGYEGFYHLCDIKGCVTEATLEYIVRDHNADCFAGRLATLRHIEKQINEKYGEGTVKLTLKEQYRNMAEKIAPCMHIVETAIEATKACGATPRIEPTRGGTDGARLSFEGLPCPNLGTGGYGFHGPYEHITAEGMDTVVDILTEIVKRYSSK